MSVKVKMVLLCCMNSVGNFLEDHCLLISIPAQEIVEANKEVEGKSTMVSYQIL